MEIAKMETVLHFQPVIEVSDEDFYAFCQLNRDVCIERNAQGDVIIMPPAGGETSERNAEITMQLRFWAKGDGTGASFDSSGGFQLPNGAVRSPDAAWIEYTRLMALSPEVRRKFVPLCPDFVIELRSESDQLAPLQEKMREYLDNGLSLGWLIDPYTRRVYVYRSGLPVEELEQPSRISGDPVLRGFELDLDEVW
ncbi:MAG: Uma2 family endonuclease [Gemmatimonadetes bacterium]|nr:Uma2 family endonuclease [Gemmatimonadota bacterium]